MKDFKYKTSFSSAILSCSVLESSEWDSWNVSKASLSSLKELMPESIDLDKNIDLLGVAFNGAVVNRFNRNGDGIDTKTALAIKDYFINKPTNMEHNRQKVVGHIVGSSFSKFGDNKLLDDQEAALERGPFNIALAAVVYKTVNPAFAAALEASQTDAFEDTISASWEIGFNDYAIAIGSQNLDEAKIITDKEQMKEFEPYLISSGGKGETDDGEKVYRLVTGEVYPLGIGFTANPAADVHGVAIIKEDDRQEKLSEKTEEKVSHLNNSTVNTQKTQPRKLTMENKELIQQLEEILDDKLSKKEYAQETVASIAGVISEAIKEKSDSYVEEKKSLEEEKARVAEAEEQLKTSVKEMEEKLATAEEQLQALQAEKQEREAKAIFNSRMAELDDIYELEDADRKIIASELADLDESEAGYEDLKAKLETLMAQKTKAFIKEQQAKMEELVSKKVAEALSNTKASAEEVVAEEQSESTEEILDNAEVEEESVPNNIAETSQQEATLSDQFKSVFNRDNVNIKY